MKKVKCIFVLVIVFCISLIGGCAVNESVHFFGDKLYYNHEGFEDKISFCVNYAYSDQQPIIELVALHGEGLENVSCVLGDISEEVFKTNLYNGYHLGSFYIDVDVSKLQDGDVISISDITIKCNGENENLNLKKDLVFVKNDFKEECYIVPMQPLQVANALPTSDVKYPVCYVFEANEEFILSEIKMSDLLGIKDISVFVNESEVRHEDGLLNLSLSKNDRLKIEVTFAISEELENANINADFIIMGENSKGQLVSRNFMLYLVGLVDENDANQLTSTIGE